MYINSILQSLLLGALLAVVVLIVFLRDWRPTLIMAFSIPFSVLCALVVMYFSGISLNIMSLGGISIAIGMLVDNSIVVLENIYRLRSRGVPPARAAVQGREADFGRGNCFHAHHHLRVLAHRLHHRHGEPADAALRVNHCLCAYCVVAYRVDHGSCCVIVPVQELCSASQQLVRDAADEICSFAGILLAP